jgi:hypothetical protein
MHVILLGIIPFALLAIVLGFTVLTWIGSALLKFPLAPLVIVAGWIAYQLSKPRGARWHRA